MGLKVLGQRDPVAVTLESLYQVPVGRSTVGSSLVVCNRGPATAFRIAVIIAEEAANNKQYLYYDSAIGANVTIPIVIGLTLNATDAVWVYATLATLSFNLFGQEI